MKTLLLLTIVLVAIVLPVLAARDPDARRGLRRLLLLLAAFNVLYLFYVTMLHPVWFLPVRPR